MPDAIIAVAGRSWLISEPDCPHKTFVSSPAQPPVLSAGCRNRPGTGPGLDRCFGFEPSQCPLNRELKNERDPNVQGHRLRG
jgi:hypothetical protein